MAHRYIKNRQETKKIDLHIGRQQTFEPQLMEYIIYTGILLLAMFFILMPFLYGSRNINYFQEIDVEKKRSADKEQNIKDDIESTKLALRDLDMENKIGKIANEDYEVLKDELLDEWQIAENQYEQIKKNR